MRVLIQCTYAGRRLLFIGDSTLAQAHSATLNLLRKGAVDAVSAAIVRAASDPGASHVVNITNNLRQCLANVVFAQVQQIDMSLQACTHGSCTQLHHTSHIQHLVKEAEQGPSKFGPRMCASSSCNTHALTDTSAFIVLAPTGPAVHRHVLNKSFATSKHIFHAV